MGARSLLPDDIERYVGETISKETPLQKRLRAETATLPDNWASASGRSARKSTGVTLRA